MKATVYAVPGSHPVKGGLAMLAHKGIEAKRVDLPNIASHPMLRVMGFPRATVPAVKIDGKRVQTTRELARELDELVPEPPLFPSDPGHRAQVEEAERWGDEVFQDVPRRIAHSRQARGARSDLASFFEGNVLGLSPRAATAIAGPILAIGARMHRATDEAVKADLAALPDTLDRVDTLIADGVIGGSERNAADFQLAPTVRLLMCFDDLRPAIEARPAGRFATEVIPSFPGRVPPVFPPEWLERLR